MDKSGCWRQHYTTNANIVEHKKVGKTFTCFFSCYLAWLARFHKWVRLAAEPSRALLGVGESSGARDPPLCKTFLSKQPTIFRGENARCGEYLLFDKVWPPLWKSWLRPWPSLGNLSTDVFETRTATGRRKQMLLACSDLSQSVGNPFFLHFKLNDTDKKSIGSPREKNSQLPVAVRVSKTSVLKLPGRRVTESFPSPPWSSRGPDGSVCVIDHAV